MIANFLFFFWIIVTYYIIFTFFLTDLEKNPAALALDFFVWLVGGRIPTICLLEFVVAIHNLKFKTCIDSTGVSSPGVPWDTQILVDQLTLFQSGGTDYAHLITTGPPRIFRPSDGPALVFK